MILNEEKSSALEDLIRDGSIENLQQILKKENIDLNSVKIETNHGDVHLLSAAVFHNQFDVCNFFIDKGANANVKDDDEYTPLFWSTQSNVEPKVMKLLLNNHADPNAVNASNSTVFERLLESFHIEKAEHLYAADITPSIKRKDGDSILHQVIKLHQHTNHAFQPKDTPVCFQVFQKVVDLGADINLLDDFSNSILFTATSFLCYDVIELLLRRGCEAINLMCGRLPYGTPLQTLCLPSFHINIKSDPHPFRHLRFILEGTHEKVKHEEEETKCIQSYIETAIIKTAELLIEYGANVNMRNSFGDTSLHLACSGKRYELAKLLIKHGADVNATNSAGRTPLITSVNPKPPILVQSDANMELLLNAGADPEITCSRGWNAFLHCVFQRMTEAVSNLLSLKTDVKYRDGNGLSALHIACWTGKLEMINLLIKNGCSVNSEDIYGGTPLFYAVGPNFKSINETLLEHGASFDHHDNNGNHVSKFCKVFEENRVGLTKVQIGWMDHPVELGLFDEITNDSKGLELNEVHEWVQNETWRNSMEEKIGSFLTPPFISASYDHKLLVKNVHILLLRVAERIKVSHPDLSFTPLLSGSVSEDTKITYPDEFDFLLCLDHFQESINIMEENSPPSYCKACQKAEVQTNLDCFDGCGYVIPSQLTTVLYTAISKVLSKEEIWHGLGLYWCKGPFVDSDSIESLEVYWVGTSYKFLPVSIDLVVAVTMRDWWPSKAVRNTNHLVARAESEGCLLVVKHNMQLEDSSQFRVSFSKVETRILTDCADVFRKGYMLAKAVRSWSPDLAVHIDPFDDDEEEEYENVNAESLLSSYILKTCLFREIEHHSQCPPTNAIVVAYNIWSRVAEAVATGALPSFFISDYKVYEAKDPDNVFHNNGYPDEHTKAISRMIASVLGKLQKI